MKKRKNGYLSPHVLYNFVCIWAHETSRKLLWRSCIHYQKNLGLGDECPPKFLVFFNSQTEAQAGAEFLRARLLPELRDKVKWFHSGMMDQFREDKMHALIISESLGEASTDAAGMVGLKVLRFEIIITKGLPITRELISPISNGLFSTELWKSLAHFGREQVMQAVTWQ